MLEPVSGKQVPDGKGKFVCAFCYEVYKVRAADLGQKAPKEVVEKPLEILKDKVIFWTKVIFTLLSQSYEGDGYFFGVERCIEEMGTNLENYYNLGDYMWKYLFLRIKFDLNFVYHLICKYHVMNPIKLPEILSEQRPYSLYSHITVF